MKKFKVFNPQVKRMFSWEELIEFWTLSDFDLNTNEKISEFNSMRECARIMNIDRKSISWSCKNIYPYAYGFKFEYL